MEVSTLLIDMGGVLLTNGWDSLARTASYAEFDVEPDEAEARHHLAFDTYEHGKFTLDEYLRFVVFYKHRHFSVQDFKDFVHRQAQPFPETIGLVTRLREKYRLTNVVMSNEGDELPQNRVVKFDMKQYIDVFVFSCFIGLRKPDPDFFRYALNLLQIEPEEAVFIDDRLVSVDVARSLGIRSIHHQTAESTARQLSEWGLV